MVLGSSKIVYDTGRADAMPCCRALGGKLLCTARGSDIVLGDGDLPSGSTCHVLRGHSGNVTCLATDASGTTLYSGAVDGLVAKWDLRDLVAAPALRLEGHDGVVTAVVICEGESVVFSAAADGLIRKWDTSTGALLTTMEGHGLMVTCLALARDDALFSGSADCSIIKWQASTGERLLTMLGHSLPVIHLTVLEATGELLSTEWGGARIVKTWSLASGTLKASQAVQQPPVKYLVL